MRKYVEPEMKVMTINLRENIAASGTPITVGGYTVYLDSQDKIIGTDVKSNKGQLMNNRENLISRGCMEE